MVVCLEQDADLHMAQLMPLPLTVSCFSKIQTGFTFLVPAHLGSPGKRPLNRCVCVNNILFVQKWGKIGLTKRVSVMVSSLLSVRSVGILANSG